MRLKAWNCGEMSKPIENNTKIDIVAVQREENMRTNIKSGQMECEYHLDPPSIENDDIINGASVVNSQILLEHGEESLELYARTHCEPTNDMLWLCAIRALLYRMCRTGLIQSPRWNVP